MIALLVYISDLFDIHSYQREESCNFNMTERDLFEACSSMDVMREAFWV